MKSPRILLLDIETSPLITYSWGLNDQNIGLNQLVKDWEIISFSAKFLGEDKIYYQDQRDNRVIRNDKSLLRKLWKLLDEADIVITQNGISFDIKRINAKLLEAGMEPPSSFKNVDTLRISRKHFSFTSHKLEYMTKKFCTKFKKSSHKKFPGMKLWEECLKGNQEAWKEMQDYNTKDILSLEELYTKLSPWDNSINYNLFSESLEIICSCGSKRFVRNGYKYTSVGKYQRYKCTKCGHESRDSVNLLSKEKRSSLKR